MQILFGKHKAEMQFVKNLRKLVHIENIEMSNILLEYYRADNTNVYYKMTMKYPEWNL